MKPGQKVFYVHLQILNPMKPKILLTETLHPLAIERAKEFADVTEAYGIKPDELIQKIPDYEAIVVRSGTKVTAEVIAAGKKLKIIGRAGVGLDNIDMDAAKKHKLEIANSPEASTISVAEHAFALLLSTARWIPQAHASMMKGEWDRKNFNGTELSEKTLGIIGFGRIGREVAIKAKAFNMNILTYDPKGTHEAAAEYGAKLVEVEELLAKSDFITLHLPSLPETKKFINSERIGLMKKNAILVNTSRGSVIDEAALYDALKNKKIKAAALDVYEQEPPKESPLLTLPNIVLTPHQAGSTDEAQRRAGTVVIDKIHNFFREGK
ncbi:Glyoxylate reductase [uncultured archaeon]|nr:Glyoxylate reductase [uncultured archaeon]